MADLKNPKLIYFKGFLFLFTGVLAGGLLILQNPSIRTAALTIIAIWSCRSFLLFRLLCDRALRRPRFPLRGPLGFRQLCDGKEEAGRPREYWRPSAIIWVLEQTHEKPFSWNGPLS